MTTTFALVRTSCWIWCASLGLASLSAACGSSPSTIGDTAGAAGKSAGTAGASSSNGGSETGSGGSTSGHAGAAGSDSSGGASEIGGASEMGGASNAAGAGTGGSSNHGGSSNGGSSSAGAGGSGGAACMKDADCGAGFNCLYKISDACGAKMGSCFKAPTGAVCASVSPYCGCSGQVVAVPCYEPTGYAPAPVTGPQTGESCAPAPDAACAGKACGLPCGTGEVPSICNGKGVCVPGGACAA